MCYTAYKFNISSGYFEYFMLFIYLIVYLFNQMFLKILKTFVIQQDQY